MSLCLTVVQFEQKKRRVLLHFRSSCAHIEPDNFFDAFCCCADGLLIVLKFIEAQNFIRESVFVVIDQNGSFIVCQS